MWRNGAAQSKRYAPDIGARRNKEQVSSRINRSKNQDTKGQQSG